VGTAEPTVDQECVEAYLFHRAPLELLLFRRPPERQRIWVPVSGKVEPEDATFEAAARRELAEETGFHEFAGFFPLDWVVVFEGPDGRTWQLTAFAAELSERRSPRLSREHDDFAWLPPDEAIRRLHFEDNRAAIARLLERVGEPPASSAPNV
jgi:8-oxo-dGTP pyrophosphatase MutT (NUDIX family)